MGALSPTQQFLVSSHNAPVGRSVVWLWKWLRRRLLWRGLLLYSVWRCLVFVTQGHMERLVFVENGCLWACVLRCFAWHTSACSRCSDREKLHWSWKRREKKNERRKAGILRGKSQMKLEQTRRNSAAGGELRESRESSTPLWRCRESSSHHPAPVNTYLEILFLL